MSQMMGVFRRNNSRFKQLINSVSRYSVSKVRQDKTGSAQTGQRGAAGFPV
jgi:hypothetical protein